MIRKRKKKAFRCVVELIVPDYCVCADNKLGPRVPLMIGDVVVCLQPDPLLTFSQETIITGLPFPILHHWEAETVRILQAEKYNFT